jgi:hypothetical protein
MMEDDHVVRDHLCRAIYDHVAAFWLNSTISEERWEHGPIEKNIPGFRVLKLKSNQWDRPIIYATSGCFSVKAEEHVRHEFFLISPTEDIRHVETMTKLANFYADKDYTLEVGTIVSIGAPWMEGSKCNNLLISIPYPYGPKLEWLKTNDACVRFLWALPITEREAGFAELHGFFALEEKLDACKVNYLDIHRPSII